MTNSIEPLAASVIITTYDRKEALLETLRALACQEPGTPAFEILVTDDGSSDGTSEAVAALNLGVPLKAFRHPRNKGISAGRNLAISEARGSALILLSDDLLVPPAFVRQHLAALRENPGFWVVGGFRQLPSLRATAFGRYLDDLEESFTAARKTAPLRAGLWELHTPTARNLSLPRADFDQAGPFDERFRVTCEDQDLAVRARDLGIRFLYDESIDCLHNDQAGDLLRCCRGQRRGTHDTVLLCAKYPVTHKGNSFGRECGPLRAGDGPRLWLRKVVKATLSTDAGLHLAGGMIAACESAGAAERLLRSLYRRLIGLYTFRGWREGLATVHAADGSLGRLL
jgi:hypothetical protein